MYKYFPLTLPKSSLVLTLTSIVIAAMPLLMITIPGGGSGCFYLLFTLGVFYTIKNSSYVGSFLFQEYPWFTIGILSWCLLVSGQMLIVGPVASRNFELILRFFAGFVIFPLAAFLPSKMLKNIEWGVILGAFSAFVFAILVAFFAPGETRAGNFFTNAITFGNISLLLGFWSLVSLYWDSIASPLKAALKFLAFFAGLYASFLSGSRGGWIAIPFFILVLVHVVSFKNLIRKGHAVVFAILFFSLGFFSKNFISMRVESVITDFKLYQGGIVHTSVGERLQLCKASVIIFKNNPVFGVGRGNFKQAIQDLATQGLVTNTATAYDHSHNEILFMMAQFGSIGLLVLLLFYCGTIISFYPYLCHRDATIKTAAHMGILLSGGFVIFGFTEVFFDKVKTIGFFIVMISSFLGIIASRKRELLIGSLSKN